MEIEMNFSSDCFHQNAQIGATEKLYHNKVRNLINLRQLILELSYPAEIHIQSI